MDDPAGAPILFATPWIALSGGSAITSIVAIVILLICSGMISASEVGFFSLSPKQLDELPQEDLRKRVLRLLEHPKRLLATILIANNLVNIAIVILSGFLTEFYLEGLGIPDWLDFVIQVVVVTFLILLFGEVLPKVYATYNPYAVVRIMVGPVWVLNGAFKILSEPLLLFSRIIDKRIKKANEGLSQEELSAVIDMTKDVTVTDEEKKIWKGIVEFGQIEVKETMKPRMDVVAVAFDTPFNELLDEILQAGYSRIPVYEQHFDTIKGVLYIKDLLPYIGEPADFKWQTLIRETLFVPENKRIDDLLKEFQHRKMHMAIVVDEYGGSSGIVTLEDIIEEIVGEINDEFDDEEIIYSKLDDSNYVFEGKTTLVNLCRILEIEYETIAPFAGEADTIAGLILEINGKLPERNAQIQCGDLVFMIESVDKKRIKRVKVTLQTPNEL